MIKLPKWQENMYSSLMDEWSDLIFEQGVETVFGEAMEEGIYRYNDLCFSFLQVLENMERFDLVEQIEEKIQ